MKGLPFGLQEPTSGFWKHSISRDERTTEYYTYFIMRPVISPDYSIVTKVGPGLFSAHAAENLMRARVSTPHVDPCFLRSSCSAGTTPDRGAALFVTRD